MKTNKEVMALLGEYKRLEDAYTKRMESKTI